MQGVSYMALDILQAEINRLDFGEWSVLEDDFWCDVTGSVP
jgi:hypothetical protein